MPIADGLASDDVRKQAEAAANDRLRVLKDEAERGGRDIHVNSDAPIRRFIFAARTIIDQANDFAKAGDLERQYLLQMRFTCFFLERMPEHKDFKSATIKQEKKLLSTACKAAMNDLDVVKAELLARYAAEAEVRIRAEAEAHAEAEAAAAAAARQAAEEQRQREEAAAAAAARAAEAAAAAEAADAAAAIEAVRQFQASEATCGVCDDDGACFPSLPTLPATLPPAHGRLAAGQTSPSAAAERIRALSMGGGLPAPPSYGATLGAIGASTRPAPSAVVPPPVMPAPLASSLSVPPVPAYSAPSASRSVGAAAPMVPTGVPMLPGVPVLPQYEPTATSLGTPLPTASSAVTPSLPGQSAPASASVAPAAQPTPLAPVPPVRAPVGGLASLNAAPMAERAEVAPAYGRSVGGGAVAQSVPQGARPNLTIPSASFNQPPAAVLPAGRAAATSSHFGATFATAPVAATSATPAAAASASGSFPAAAGGEACGCRPPPFAWNPTCGAGACGPGACGVPAVQPPPTSVGLGGGSGAARYSTPNLRTLVIPRELPATFLSLAASNTARNVETCAILVGQIIDGELRTSQLLVPSQSGTSDTCVTTNEDEIWYATRGANRRCYARSESTLLRAERADAATRGANRRCHADAATRGAN